MESSNRKNNEELFDPIRKKWICRTKEEAIRQNLIHFMVHKLGYPIQLIGVEKEIAQLVVRTSDKLPQRRVDIVVFSQKKLTPILLIECKAHPLTRTSTGQVFGYNAFINAPFVALANDQTVLIGSYDPSLQSYRFQEGLPTFAALSELFNKRCSASILDEKSRTTALSMALASSRILPGHE